MEIELPYNWSPRPYQQPLWSYLESGGTRAVAVWHRRAGKDDVCLRWASVSAMTKPATYWHMLPEYAQARKAIWNSINPHTGIRRIDEAFPLDIRANTNDQEMFIRFKNGATWQVVGSDSYDNTVGSPPAGIVFSEWALAKPQSWSYLQPILEENGGWAFFIYTPRGENHGKSMLELSREEEGWFGELLTVDDTKIFTHDQLEKIKRELIKLYGQTRGLAQFNQEYYCSFYEAFDGKPVYPDFNRKLHVATEPLLPFVKEGVKRGGQIVRGWDNTGLHPACVLTYVNSMGQWFVFKEFWGNDITCVDFADSVILWCNQNFEGCQNYRDIADPAGYNRDTMKKSPAQYVFEHCQIRLENGIQTFRTRVESVARLLNTLRNGEPAIIIDPSCDILIKGFEGGYGYPEIGNSGVYKSEISGSDKNMYADVHDALQYPATRLFLAEQKDEYEEYDGRVGRSRSGGY